MKRGILLAFFLLLPGLALGATLEGEQNLILSEPPADNAYLMGANIEVRAPVPADLTAAGGTITISAPISGDVLVAGGTLDIEQPVGGDVRAAAARVIIGGDVAGDLSALGGVVLVSGKARDIQMMGATVRVTGGADGNVTVYGEDVYLSGEYLGNVTVSASDRVTLADDTVIRGVFRYNAPQQVFMAPSVQALGGVEYIGPASYVPSFEEAQRVALAGAGVFFLVKALAAIVAAGLVTGIFPRFSEQVLARSSVRSPRKMFMHALLGFALIILTPVILILLTVSFVGIGIALILAALYLLMLMLAYVYAGFLAGVGILYAISKKRHKSWRAAVLGMFALHVIGLVPIIGSVIVFVFILIAAGALAKIAYEGAWGNEEVAH
ncbi:MAG TPA: hypothetical protein VNU47_01170 [Candidatus Paceibacterota bacterium]|nr:hypothetical protein [Candidatus Paceibacterota bacterium]